MPEKNCCGGVPRGDEANESAALRPMADGSSEISLSMDAILDMLVDSERRALLRCLSEAPGNTTTVSDLVDLICEHEADLRGEHPAPSSVEVRLHHIHVPKLLKAGLIEYDARSEEIRYYPNDRLETWLDRIQAEEGEEA